MSIADWKSGPTYQEQCLLFFYSKVVDMNEEEVENAVICEQRYK
jgi:hypothetical protein